jgi:3-oxoacyl-[acyl-carrier-protein] synthase II
MMRRVVVTGIGIVSPLGIGHEAFWSNLIAGEPGIRRVRQFDPSGLPCQIAGEVPPFQITDFVPKSYRKATKVMARDIHLAVVAANLAFKDAGVPSRAGSESPAYSDPRFMCNIGAGLISFDLNELTAAMAGADVDHRMDLRRWGSEAMNGLTPLWLLKYLPNMLGSHVTIIHGLTGISNTITCGEASGHLAIGESFRVIQRGDADRAICGGSETKVNPLGLVRQVLLKRLAIDSNSDPAAALRPFDANASGTVLGEGGGLLILEELSHALNHGARIYAEVSGFGASQDVSGISDPDPTGRTYALAIQSALEDARIAPSDVDLLMPCGEGIPSHDRAELRGLETAFGDRLKDIPLTPIKAQTGHLGAGNGLEAAATVLALHHNTLCPAVNTTRPADGRTLNASPVARAAKIDTAVSTAFSLGGQNAALVFQRYA